MAGWYRSDPGAAIDFSSSAVKPTSSTATSPRMLDLHPPGRKKPRLASILLAALDDRKDLDASSQMGTREKLGKESRDGTEVQAFSLQAISPGESIPRLSCFRC